MQKPDTTNPVFHLAASFVQLTDSHLFLTGKAGTGKTTFLHHIKTSAGKATAVVAPTGVAAINAGGVTMHSFFQLPFRPFVPGVSHDPAAMDERTFLSELRINKEKRALLNELELLIIDEISMVRADQMDAIDTLLRHVRHKDEPFGGVQVLMIGDLYQLSPVATSEDWSALQSHYPGTFFFHSRVIQKCRPVCLELNRVYRQTDGEFIRLLNNVRENTMSPEDFALLDSRYQPNFSAPEGQPYIVLTSHNHKANAINEHQLAKLPGKAYSFEADVEGEFHERAFPADGVLRLKQGAQVMFIRNDKGEDRRYFNGKLAKVEEISNGTVYVSFSGEEGRLMVEEEEWKNIRYSYDDEEGVREEELGSFRQLPIRLAWAVTIHKSQGLTFERAVVDAGESFTSGQVYVALSRLTSLEGLVLKSRITPGVIQRDEVVSDFMNRLTPADQLELLLQARQQVFLERQLIASFDWSKLVAVLQEHLEAFDSRKIPDKEAARDECRKWFYAAEQQQEVARKFTGQLTQLLQPPTGKPDYERVHERVQAACGFFEPKLSEELLQPLAVHDKASRVQKGTKKYVRALAALAKEMHQKQAQLERAKKLAQGFKEGWDSAQLRTAMTTEPINLPKPEPVKTKAVVGETRLISLQMFREGKTIAEIAEARGMVTGTIGGHLAGFVETGEITLEQIVSQEHVDLIRNYVKTNGVASHGLIRNALDNQVEYYEIKAVLANQKPIS